MQWRRGRIERLMPNTNWSMIVNPDCAFGRASVLSHGRYWYVSERASGRA